MNVQSEKFQSQYLHKLSLRHWQGQHSACLLSSLHNVSAFSCKQIPWIWSSNLRLDRAQVSKSEGLSINNSQAETRSIVMQDLWDVNSLETKDTNNNKYLNLKGGSRLFRFASWQMRLNFLATTSNMLTKISSSKQCHSFSFASSWIKSSIIMNLISAVRHLLSHLNKFLF